MTASLGRLWAVARMTLLEAVRRRVFVILLIFSAALLMATVFFPAVDPAGRMRLLQAWSLRAAYLFTAVVALFLAGFSLPSDFEQKRIYLLVSKPLSKPMVFLGRLLGFSLLLALFVAAMAVLSAGFMRAVAWTAGPQGLPLAAYPRVLAEEFHYPRGRVLEERDGPMGVAVHGGGLVWRFDGLSKRQFGDVIRAQVRLYVGAPDDYYRVEGRIQVLARTAAGREVRLPDLTLHSNEDTEFTIPASAIEGSGRLELMLRPLDEDGLIAGHKGRLFLFRPSILFEAAYLRGMGLVLLQSLIVLATTLAASTFVSAPLSIILGIFVYLVGVTHSYVAEGTRDIQRSLGEAATTGRSSGVVKEVGTPVAWLSTIVTKATLWMIPDFQHFDYSRWLLKDLTVSGREAGAAALRAFVPTAFLALLGVLVMRYKDFG